MGRTTLVALKSTEVQLLLALLRSGPSTRGTMGRVLGCSPATVFRASDALAAAGWIDETPLGDSPIGRRPGLMNIRPQAAYFIAMHLSANRALISVVDANLGIVAVETKVVSLNHTGPEDLLDALDPLIEAMLSSQGLGWADAKAVGMALAGRTDYEAGRPVTPPNLPLWHGHPLRQEMFDRWGLPAVLDNDANLMALGEGLRGSGRGVPNFLFVNLDLGIGAGLVLDGRLYRGAKGFSGELGHTRVGGYNNVCACGKLGCLQAVASTPAILARARTRATKDRGTFLADVLRRTHGLRVEDIAAAADAGDDGALAIVAEAGSAIGEVLSGAVNILNPDEIVLGGGLTALGAGLLSAIRRAVARDTLPGSAQGLPIRMSQLGDNAALVGVAALALDLIVAAGVRDPL